MNRFKLLKVGDELHLVRQQQPGVNDILKPDTLNRTNIRLEDDLEESLGVDDAQIEGVSKDIQLVSIIGSQEALEQHHFSFEWVDTGGENFDIPMGDKRFVSLIAITLDSVNNTAGGLNYDLYLRGTVTPPPGSGNNQNIQLGDFGPVDLTNQETTQQYIVPFDGGVSFSTVVNSNSASNPIRSMIDCWGFDIPTDVFDTIYLRIEPDSNPDIFGTIRLAVVYHNRALGFARAF